MLAYVFWHWPRPDADPARYLEALRSFHQTLKTFPPRGYRGSRILLVEGAPWAKAPHAFEDWYFLDDFDALGALNEAAVSGLRKAPHDGAARLSQGGAAGIHLGRAEGFGALHRASWFGKPRGSPTQRSSRRYRQESCGSASSSSAPPRSSASSMLPHPRARAPLSPSRCAASSIDRLEATAPAGQGSLPFEPRSSRRRAGPSQRNPAPLASSLPAPSRALANRSACAFDRLSVITEFDVLTDGSPMPKTTRTAQPYRDLAVIDARAPRFNQAVVGLLALAATLTGATWLLGLIGLQLAVGLLFGRRYCLPCVAYFELVQPWLGEGPLEDSRPPRFANQIGATVTFAGAAAGLLGHPAIAAGLGALVATLALLAAATGFCLGCSLYRLGARLRGLRPGTPQRVDLAELGVRAAAAQWCSSLTRSAPTARPSRSGWPWPARTRSSSTFPCAATWRTATGWRRCRSPSGWTRPAWYGNGSENERPNLGPEVPVTGQAKSTRPVGPRIRRAQPLRAPDGGTLGSDLRFETERTRGHAPPRGRLCRIPSPRRLEP